MNYKDPQDDDVKSSASWETTQDFLFTIFILLKFPTLYPFVNISFVGEINFKKSASFVRLQQNFGAIASCSRLPTDRIEQPTKIAMQQHHMVSTKGSLRATPTNHWCKSTKHDNIKSGEFSFYSFSMLFRNTETMRFWGRIYMLRA